MDILEAYSTLDTIGMILGIAYIIVLGIMILGVAVYICTGLAYYKAGQAEDIQNRWLAWIPVGNSYMMLRIAEKDIRLLFVFAAAAFISFIKNFTEVGLFINMLSLALIIAGTVISIQCYLVIGRKYGVKPAWFITGCFILPVMIVPMIMLYNRAKRISNGEDSIIRKEDNTESNDDYNNW